MANENEGKHRVLKTIIVGATSAAAVMVAGILAGITADRKDCNDKFETENGANNSNNSGKEEPTKVICEGITDPEPETYVDAVPTEEQ